MKAVKQHLRLAIDSLYSRGLATEETYTRLVLDCFRVNDVQQAKRLQTHMELHLFEPHNAFLYNRLLHVYTKSGNLTDARNLFDRMPKRDVFSWNALLSAYSRLGSVEDLWEIFNSMSTRDSVSYNTVITCLAGRNGTSKKALEVFSIMQKDGFDPTDHTHVSALRACSQLLDVRCGKQIHGRLSACGGIGGNVFIANALISMYANCGDLDNARSLFERIGHKNVVSWNSMISGYVTNGQPEKCIELYNEMQFLALKPDQVTYSNILKAYLQGGHEDSACKLFSEMHPKDKYCWTTMIVGFAQIGKEEDALLLFKEMLSQNVKPDSFSISSVVGSCAKLAFLYYGQAVHAKSIHIDISDNLLVSSALVDMYCKCGVVSDAIIAFNLMPTRSLVSWNTMIGGYARNGKDVEAINLYEKLLQENLKPDRLTLVGVLSACMHAGLVLEGQQYFNSISKVHGLRPTQDHYACMINLLGRSDCIARAVHLIKNMPYEPNSLVWSTLLSVCVAKGDIEHAEMAAKHLFELEPLNAVPYIMLSNLYAAHGKWKEVSTLRALMKIKRIKKLAACSWIEIDGKVHKFVSEDRTHPDTKIIYEALNKMIRKLQETGFTPNTKLVLHDTREEEKFDSICFHSEKLALAYFLIRKPQVEVPIRIFKNIRVCVDCHVFMKYVSRTTGRTIILRDSNRFHHFVNGNCLCKDEW